MTDPKTVPASGLAVNEELVSQHESSEENNVTKAELASDVDLASGEHVKRRRRYGLLVFAYLYTFFFSGAFFGYGPMQLLLEENGSFASKCTAEEQQREEVCPSQSAALVRIHFAATMSQFVSPFLGELLDRYGPAFLSYLMGTCGCLGVMLLILAARSPDKEWILFVAFLAIANSCWMVSE